MADDDREVYDMGYLSLPGPVQRDLEHGLVHGSVAAEELLAIGPPTPPERPLVVLGDDGRELLAIHRDGSVTGEARDASEAARVFVREVSALLRAAGMDAPAQPPGPSLLPRHPELCGREHEPGRACVRAAGHG